MRQRVVQTLKRVPRNEAEDAGAIELVWEIDTPRRAEQETGDRTLGTGNRRLSDSP